MQLSDYKSLLDVVAGLVKACPIQVFTFRQVDNSQHKPKTSMSEAPQARYEALRYSQTSGQKQTHLTFNIRRPGNSVLKLELPKTSLKGMVKTVKRITNYLSPLRPSKQHCFTLPGFRNQEDQREKLFHWVVCFVVVMKRGFSRLFSHQKCRTAWPAQKDNIYRGSERKRQTQLLRLCPHGQLYMYT